MRPSGNAAPGKVAILGVALTSRNQGVQALGAALVRLCMETRPSTEVVMLCSHPDNRPVTMSPLGSPTPIRVVNWRLSPKAHPREHLLVILLASCAYRILPFRGLRAAIARRIPWIGELEQAGLVGDVRGGDSFSDIYGLKRFLIATLPILTVILVKGSIVQFPQTYGPYKTRTARMIARWILKRSSTVIARDKASQAVAQALLGDSKRVLLSPDVAFALQPVAPRALELDGVAAPGLPADIAGLNVNGLMYNGGYTRNNMFGLKLDYVDFLSKLVPALLAAHPGPLLLVPHTYAPAGDVESDNDACARLKKGLPAGLQHRVHIVTSEHDAHELKGIIGQCAFFIGSRMHSCIAALSQGVPCVGVAYSMKFRGVFETAETRNLIVDARSTGTDEAVGAILDFHRNLISDSGSDHSGTSSAKARLLEVFGALAP